MFRYPLSMLTCMLGILSCVVVSAGEWTSVRCPAADLDPLDRFDVANALTGFEDGASGWKAGNGAQNAKATTARSDDEKHGGKASLRVDFEFAGDKKLEYVEVGIDAEMPQPGLGLGLWAKSTGLPLGLRLRVQDKSGETHQFEVDSLPSAEWRFVAISFSKQAGHWGGDNNGKLDYPCRITSLIADRPRQGFRAKGTFWVDDVSVVRERKITEKLTIETATPVLGNVYEPGTKLQLRAKAPEGTIRWKATDFYGHIVGQGEGAAEGTPIEFELKAPGHYVCVVEARKDNQQIDARIFRCAALLPADPGKRNTFGGVCTHFQRVEAWPPEGLDLLVRYGITEIRDEISWGSVEREKGKYQLPVSQSAFTVRAKELGINPLLIWSYGNRFYNNAGFPNDEEAWQAYAKYCVAEAEFLHDRVKDFEVWNEWSVGCGMNGKPGSNKPEFYAPMLVAAYKAVKAKFPELNIVGLGGEHSAHHFANIEVMLQKGAAKSMDCLSVHSYRYPSSPEESDLFGEIMKVADLAKKYDAPCRIWVSEIGWPTHLGGRGVDEPKQARYLVRTLALLQATGVVEKVHWYDFKNDGFEREYNEANFGIVWHQQFNWAPKPAVVSYSVFNRMTAGAKCAGLTHNGPLHVVKYTRPDGHEVQVAWVAEGEQKVVVKGNNIVAADLMGAPVQVPGDGSMVLTGNPVYLSGRGLAVSGQ